MWSTNWNRAWLVALTVGMFAAGAGCPMLPRAAAESPGKETASPWLHSLRSGPWSAPATWEGGKVPGAGARVQIRTGHTVTYDLKSEQLIRSIHVAGTLTFAGDKDTRLDVGLIKI